jgi:DNA-binding GntR family transcriptional regulator
MSLATTTFSHTQLRRQVAERIRAAILDGEIQPGEWLRQEQLAQEYGVSQMPVREALKELAAEGLVEHLPYRGARVIAFSAEDVADLYQHRSFLEGWAARAAAGRITPAEVAELKRLQAQMKEKLAVEYLAEYRQLNRRFHELIFTASDRPYLARTLTQMWAAFPNMLWSNFARTAAESLPQRDASDPGEHEAIIAALEKGEGEEAERLMQQHILSAGRELVATLRS